MEERCQNKGREKEVLDNGGGSGVSSSGASNIVISKDGNRIKLRGPIEDTWSHGEKYKGKGWSCAYCGNSKESGGKTRFTQHLAGLQGEVVPCGKVPAYVRQIMLDVHANGRKNRLSTQECRLYVEKAIMEKTYEEDRRKTIPRDEAGQVEWALRESMRDYRARGSTSPLGMASGSNSPLGMASGSTPPLGRSSCSGNQTTIKRFYRSPSVSQVPFDIDLARSKAPSQPRIDTMLQGGAKVRLGKAFAKWFQSEDIPGRKADNPYFVSAIKLAQELGEGVAIPTGRDIDGPLLDMNYDDLKAQMEDFKENWGQFGVTIMCDSWTGPTKMCIINFMIFCNGRTFFHKSVNATGRVQNADFIYDLIKEVVVEEIGLEFVVQIVTDNGSNYKKACKQLTNEYKHITWQPCAAHTINLMLKDITRQFEVEAVVVCAKRICNFLYNHNRLHAMMREKIGGELIRWNATRFGTVFLFLQSFIDKREKFEAWMISSDWKNSDFKDEEDHEFTTDCLMSRVWWEDVEMVLKSVTPLYSVLRYADQEKNATISGFIPKLVQAQKEIFAVMKHGKRISKDLLRTVNEVINRRARYLLNSTLMLAAAALDPESLYKANFANLSSARLAVTLAFKKLAKSPMEASKAIDQFAEYFCQKKLLFGSLEARGSALRGKTSAADWWNQYGGHCKELQRLAKLIVSQCTSSSGCERNWSTFALVHTKLRNRLGYEKLDKLVYVHYNLKLAIHQFESDFRSLRKKDADPCSMMMDVALFDEDNPIMDWLSNSRSESKPILDEYDDDDDEWTTPGGFLIDELNIQPEEISEFKRKLSFSRKGSKKKGKRVGLEDEEEEFFEDDNESDSSHGSPVYAESGDSSSASDEEAGVDDVGRDGSGGGNTCGEASGSCVRNLKPHSSGAPIRPRSTRIKKPTVKKLSQL